MDLCVDGSVCACMMCVCVCTRSVGEVVILHKCMHLKELYRGTCFGELLRCCLRHSQPLWI